MTDHREEEIVMMMDLVEMDNVATVSQSSLDVWLKLLSKHVAKLIVDHSDLKRQLDEISKRNDENGEDPQEPPEEDEMDEDEIMEGMKIIQGKILALSAKQRHLIKHMKVRSQNAPRRCSGDSRRKRRSSEEAASTSSATSSSDPSVLVFDDNVPSTSSSALQRQQFYGVAEDPSQMSFSYKQISQRFSCSNLIPDSFPEQRVAGSVLSQRHPSEFMVQSTFLSMLGLVTPQESVRFKHELEKSKMFRKRRSTANPKYASYTLNVAFSQLHPKRRNCNPVTLESLAPYERNCVYKKMILMDNNRFQELLLRCFICDALGCNMHCGTCTTKYHSDCVRIPSSKAHIPRLLALCPKCIHERKSGEKAAKEKAEAEAATAARRARAILAAKNRLTRAAAAQFPQLKRKLQPKRKLKAVSAISPSRFKKRTLPVRSARVPPADQIQKVDEEEDNDCIVVDEVKPAPADLKTKPTESAPSPSSSQATPEKNSRNMPRSGAKRDSLPKLPDQFEFSDSEDNDIIFLQSVKKSDKQFNKIAHKTISRKEKVFPKAVKSGSHRSSSEKSKILSDDQVIIVKEINKDRNIKTGHASQKIAKMPQTHLKSTNLPTKEVAPEKSMRSVKNLDSARTARSSQHRSASAEKAAPEKNASGKKASAPVSTATAPAQVHKQEISLSLNPLKNIEKTGTYNNSVSPERTQLQSPTSSKNAKIQETFKKLASQNCTKVPGPLEKKKTPTSPFEAKFGVILDNSKLPKPATVVKKTEIVETKKNFTVSKAEAKNEKVEKKVELLKNEKVEKKVELLKNERAEKKAELLKSERAEKKAELMKSERAEKKTDLVKSDKIEKKAELGKTEKIAETSKKVTAPKDDWEERFNNWKNVDSPSSEYGYQADKCRITSRKDETPKDDFGSCKKPVSTYGDWYKPLSASKTLGNFGDSKKSTVPSLSNYKSTAEKNKKSVSGKSTFGKKTNSFSNGIIPPPVPTETKSTLSDSLSAAQLRKAHHAIIRKAERALRINSSEDFSESESETEVPENIEKKTGETPDDDENSFFSSDDGQKIQNKILQLQKYLEMSEGVKKREAEEAALKESKESANKGKKRSTNAASPYAKVLKVKGTDKKQNGFSEDLKILSFDSRRYADKCGEEEWQKFSRKMDAIFEVVCHAPDDDEDSIPDIPETTYYLPKHIPDKVATSQRESSGKGLNSLGNNMKSLDSGMSKGKKSEKSKYPFLGKMPVVSESKPPAKVYQAVPPMKRAKGSARNPKKITMRTIIPPVDNRPTDLVSIFSQALKWPKLPSPRYGSSSSLSELEDDPPSSPPTCTNSAFTLSKLPSSTFKDPHADLSNSDPGTGDDFFHYSNSLFSKNHVHSTLNMSQTSALSPTKATTSGTHSPTKPVGTTAINSAGNTPQKQTFKPSPQKTSGDPGSPKKRTKRQKKKGESKGKKASPSGSLGPGEDDDLLGAPGSFKGGEYCIRNVSIGCETCRDNRLKCGDDSEFNGGCNGPKGSSNGLANLPTSCVTVKHTLKAMTAAAQIVLMTSAKAKAEAAAIPEEKLSIIPPSPDIWPLGDPTPPTPPTPPVTIPLPKSEAEAVAVAVTVKKSEKKSEKKKTRVTRRRPSSPRHPDRFTAAQREELIDRNREIMREMIELKSTELDLYTCSPRGRSPSPSQLSDISMPLSSLKSV